MDKSLCRWLCAYNNNNDNTTLPGTIDVWKGSSTSALTIKCPIHNDATNVLIEISAERLSGNWDGNNVSHSYSVQGLLRCEDQQKEHLPPKVTKYEAKLGACVMIGGKSWNKNLAELIAYHRIMGIEHFWLHFRVPWEEISGMLPVNQSDLTFVPYAVDFYDRHTRESLGEVYRVWHWHNALNKDCLHRAKKYKFDWLITTDPDELIWVAEPPQNATTNGSTNAEEEGEDRKHPLQHFLNHRLTSKDRSLSALRMRSIPYGWNHELDDSNKNNDAENPVDPVLQMDYTYRYNVALWEREKRIINVQNAHDLEIHFVRGPDRDLDWETEVSFDHFKKPAVRKNGIYFPKPQFGNLNRCIIRDTSMPDAFRPSFLETILSTVGTVPFGNTAFSFDATGT